MSQSSSEIAAQMSKIRARRDLRVRRLATQSERLTDWREHVRAAPLTSFVVSILGGVLLVRSFQHSRRKNGPISVGSSTTGLLNGRGDLQVRSPRRVLATATSFVLPILANVIRRQLIQAVSSKLATSQPSAESAHGHNSKVTNIH